ncbi:MAG: TonB-dependent receptor [Novosphingobium sp.]|nr:TonB-dependent receptor [Novosphingobium sp.]
MKRLMIAGAALLLTAPASAQDLGGAEIIVTGQRGEQDDYSKDMPSVGLRRTADFLIQEVKVSGDTRDDKQRSQEIHAMIEQALRLADKHGVELAFGDFVVQPLTLTNYKDLTLTDDRSRPDSQFVTFLVKAPLGDKQSASEAEKRIAGFISAVPEVGRAQMDKQDDVSFSVVAPDAYRDAIASKITEDARQMAAKLGDGYAVQIEGLNMPVQWSRSGLSEVFLYIPYKLTILPKP